MQPLREGVDEGYGNLTNLMDGRMNLMEERILNAASATKHRELEAGIAKNTESIKALTEAVGRIETALGTAGKN